MERILDEDCFTGSRDGKKGRRKAIVVEREESHRDRGLIQIPRIDQWISVVRFWKGERNP